MCSQRDCGYGQGRAQMRPGQKPRQPPSWARGSGEQMSNMPERDAAGQWSGGTQQSAPPGAPSQGGAPGQERFGSAPSGGGQGRPQGAGMAGDQRRGQPGRRAPVTEAETRV